MSTNIKNLSGRGPDQIMKPTDKTRDITTVHDILKIFVYFFLYFRPSEVIGCADGLQAARVPEV